MKNLLNVLSLVAVLFMSKATFAQAPANDLCANATNITSSLGGATNVAVNAGSFTNVAATTSTGEAPAGSYACFGESTPTLNNTVWFTFTGDGSNYELRTDGGVDGDHQLALYSGTCGALTAVACNEDISGTNYNSALTYQTVNGTTYYLMADGWDGYTGAFTLYVTNKTVITCANAVGGTGSPIAGAGNEGPNICPNDTIWFDVDGATVPVSTAPAVSGFFWALGTDMSLTANDIVNAGANYFGSFAASPQPGYRGFIYNGTNLPNGTFYFYPVTFGNATGPTPANTPTSQYTFDAACMHLGTPIQYNFLTSTDPLCGGAVIDCSMAMGGTANLINTSANICWGDTIEADVTGTMIPTNTANGFVWALSVAPLTNNNITNDLAYLGAAGVSATPTPVGLINDGSIIPETFLPLTLYFTPVVFGNAVGTGTDISTYTLDSTNCVNIGTPISFTLLPSTDPTCTVGVTSIKDLSSINVFPNPANEVVKIALTFVANKDYTVQLTNSLGQNVFNERYVNSLKELISINTSSLASGVYQLSIISNNERTSRKVVITK